MLIQFSSIYAINRIPLAILVIYLTPIAPVKIMIAVHFLIHHVVMTIVIIVAVNAVKVEDLNKIAKILVSVHIVIQFIK